MTTDATVAVTSRLDRMISRLATQRACLAFAAAEIDARPGPVLEIGLGKGRTFDHLRHILGGREIFALDRDIHAPKDCIPDDTHLLLGDFQATLPGLAARLAGTVVLAHADIGTEDREADRPLAAFVGDALAPAMAPGGLVVGDREMMQPGWNPLALPSGAGDWPYFMYRVSAD